MMTFDAAVAEYLHRTDHARPWTRRQEEDALDGLSGWLHAGRRTVPLSAVTPQLVARYAAQAGLSPEELDDLHGTLAGLRCWARAAGAPGSHLPQKPLGEVELRRR
ncbi:MAG TPA: hypothetical protein VF142_24120 [Longimicrobium sp.]